MYKLVFMSQAQKDAIKIARAGLKHKVLKILNIIKEDPFKYPPRYELLKGELKGMISRRINRQHRLIYEVFEEEKIIKIYKMWTHYE